jgi:putative Holliday junction resolvase
VSLLAFDFGLNNIGVASGQAITRSAGAVTTLKARAGVPDWKAVDALVREWQPDVLVVGLPLNMDKTMSAMAKRAKQFAAALRARYALDVEMVDERLTSFEARGLSDDINAQHAIAARLIAETYLNSGGQSAGGLNAGS